MINKIKNIIIHPYGLSDKNGILNFYAPNDRNNGRGSFIPNYISDNKFYNKISVVNGDEYFLKNKINKIDIIKIDVESFEDKVLIGLKKSLESNRPVVVMELTDYNKDYHSSLNKFLKLFPDGYKIFKIISNRRFLYFFNRSAYKCENISDFLKGEPEYNVILYPREKANTVN